MGGAFDYNYKKEQIVVHGSASTVSKDFWKLTCGCNSISNKYFANIGDDDYVRILLRVGSDFFIEANIEITAMGKGLVSFYENPALDSVGSTVLVTNPNRESQKANGTTLLVYHTPIIGSAGPGVVLYPEKLLPGSESAVPFVLGLKNGLNGLWKLNKGTDYLVVLQNKSGGTADFSIEIAASREKN